MQKPWSLYNKEDKLRVDNLSSDQVRVVILSTATSRMSHWFACQEGDVHWQPITGISEFYEDVRQIKGTDEDIAKMPAAEPTQAEPIPKAPPRRPLFEDLPPDVKTSTLQMESINTKERRTARRYPRRLNFTITVDGRSFAANTIDVSMSGLSIDKALPAWAVKSFTATLELNQTSVRVLCSRVDEYKLKIKDASSWDVIRAWIVNW